MVKSICMSLMIFLISLPLSVRGQPETSGPSSGIMAILTGNPVTKARRSEERYTKDPLAVRSLTPVFDEFPDSSLVDFSYLLDPPAGKHGFVIVGDDGYFHFEKTGKRIRFWGVTVAAAHIDIPRERIRQAVDVIARAGCNVLRLHEIDNRGGEKYNLVRRNIIDEAYPHSNDSRHFDAEYRDRVDYWIACAREKGIYVYLVIRGYRTFRAGDGVAAAEKLDRKAQPYGFFNPTLLGLQDEYIEEWLFRHKNPYTGLPNGLDPAVCMLELENEDSLLFNPSDWVEFIEPYKSEFQKLWNEWLKDKYKSTDALRTAWTIPDGTWSALLSEEKLENGTVQIPDMRMRQGDEIKPEQKDDALSHPLRQRDGAQFAAYIQRKFFMRQRDLIRSKGCPIPLTAVVNSLIIPDTWSVVQDLDFSGENAYQDHPSFKAGEAWVGKSFFSNKNYLKETGPWSLGPHMARYKWAGKPLVCREWANCWPNEYRGSANLAIAGQALLQDYDAMIYFSYYTWGNQSICSPFGIQADPVQWGTFGYASHLFLTEGIKPEERVIDIAFNETDLFTWGQYVDSLHTLSWNCRVQNVYFPGAIQSDADIRISSGRSGTGVYPGIFNILWDVHADRWAKIPPSLHKDSIYYQSGYRAPFLFTGEDLSTSSVLQAGYEPILRDKDTSLGFYDPQRQNIVLKNAGCEKAVEAARNLLQSLSIPGAKMKSQQIPDRLVSQRGDVIRDVKKGYMIIDTPGFKAIQGELAKGESLSAGTFSVSSQSPIACLIAFSLDGKPLEEADFLAVKMTTIAHNRGQILRPVKGEDVPGDYVLDFPGSAPVQTEGKPSAAPTILSIGDNVLVEAYLVNGTWEAVFDRKKGDVLLSCDTPNIRFRLGPAAFQEKVPEILFMQSFYYEYEPAAPVEIKPDLIYPGFSKYIHVTREKDPGSGNGSLRNHKK